ncbi:hypothetical protein K9M79_04315 [Candidatus Woesearchaeota archaeon]|nr:hypothetical protein [Candidatus Woesearchaeota archaeon]
MNRNHLTRIFVFVLIFSLVAMSVHAAIGGVQDIGDAFGYIKEFIKQENVAYGLMLILMYMLIYSITAAGARFAHIFGGQGQLNKEGKVVSNAIAGLSTLSLFYFADPSTNFWLQKVLVHFGDWAMFYGTIAFGIIGYNLMKGDVGSRAGAGLISAGIAMLTIGQINGDWFMHFGWILMIIGAIMWISQAWSAARQTPAGGAIANWLGGNPNQPPVDPRTQNPQNPNIPPPRNANDLNQHMVQLQGRMHNLEGIFNQLMQAVGRPQMINNSVRYTNIPTFGPDQIRQVQGTVANLRQHLQEASQELVTLAGYADMFDQNMQNMYAYSLQNCSYMFSEIVNITLDLNNRLNYHP